MWPSTYWTWRGEDFFQSVFAVTRNYLTRFPVLESAGPRIAFLATETAFDLADDRRHSPGHFADARSFRRWLNEAARGEARRRAVTADPVPELLQLLNAEDRQLLHWHYADQLSPERMALLRHDGFLLASNMLPLETEEAWQLVGETYDALVRAYERLCELLKGRGLDKGPWTFPW
jgi:hypothetical protein